MKATTSPAGVSKLAGLTFLATALGIPSATIAFFKDQVAALPWGAKAGLFGLWFVLSVATALWAEVWKHLKGVWGKRLADWIDVRVRTLFSRYRRRYLEFLYYQHRDLDVKGLSTHGPYNLELEDVFVDLTINPRAIHDATTDPIRIPRELTGRRPIWDYLQSEALARQPLVLIGPPGSGKTTLLKEIALQLTGRHRNRRRLRRFLPVLLFLREHAAAVDADPSLTLSKAVEEALDRKQGPAPPAGWVEEQVRSGRCLVLLDGLDEVPAAETRRKVVAWVEIQMKAYGTNRFIVSSRPHGYRSNPIAGVTALEVESFNVDQVHRFVFNWYKATEARASGKIDPGVEMKAREGAEDLLRRLRTSQTLFELAVNPLLLTMIATVHRFRSRLPGRRVELYAEICEVFLGTRQAARGLEADLTPAQKQRVLQPLAFHLMRHEKREIDVDEAVRLIRKLLHRVGGRKADARSFLKDVEDGSGLLLEREAGVYGFAHLAFQEYLAAVHAREEGKEEELIREVESSWWHETLRLYGAQGDASSLLARCLASDPPTVAALTLAIDFLEEAREADPKWREKVDDFVAKGVESDDPERFRLAAETLLGRRVRGMVAVDKTTFVDPIYVTHAEYQLFLDEMRAQGRFHQPDHWTEWRFPPGEALTPVVGMRPSDVRAFCEFLSRRYNPWTFRLPKPEELGRHGFRADRSSDGIGMLGYWAESAEGAVFEWKGADLTTPLSSYIRDRVLSDLSDDDGLDLHRAHALDFNPSLARYAALAVDVDHARARARALDLDQALDVDHALALARAPAPARHRDYFTPASARTLALALARTLVLALGLGTARALAFAITRARALHLARELASALDRALARELASALDLDPARTLARKLFILTCSFRSTRLFRRSFRDVEALEKASSSLYVSLINLDGRIKGELNAVEGIRLVKERATRSAE